ncbi:bifunctional 3'-5' exonuclease/DNA polymerase [Arthrobacter psychrochitiniphilus]|uniref:DNA-directed DNA polymerase n=1 Tax=Arthrobacter psychrochitiniphilus TaxID=291045 RepID=A0A2V3DW77_9MICC|nr:bifunctional 3'-5' exonuclease/DNA polymerase [Arthrobacter psychrochitiniphilus]NYG15692.1 DNA polymerase-1 [Arthrobacter psychrochitiniphilus]PXA66839.1 bifunctional 3'-5' exonuclease/DNA polymerase [Arthrobacter psychrochitiniphilus]
MYALLALTSHESAAVVQLRNDDGTPASPVQTVSRAALPAVVRALEEAHHPRWVWDRATHWYPDLLAANVRLERCHDLSLCQNILLYSAFAADTDYARQATPVPPEAENLRQGTPLGTNTSSQDSLFDAPVAAAKDKAWDLAAVAKELGAQKSAISSSTHPARLTLLLSAESAGALVAAEMHHEGIPWREDLHRRLLNDLLGPEPALHNRPEKLEALADLLRTELNAPTLNPDSPQELIRALHRAGIDAKSTRSWELQEFNHPAIAPLLTYRKLSRLFTTNGWNWLHQWVREGRFHSEYVVGGVVSGRWASRGGGAMQIPAQIRGAAVADPGYTFIVADAAQLEPRVLAALSQDSAMAAAGRDAAGQSKDLYAGIAAQGFGGDRSMAKIALLGAIYGATTGESGRLVPQLARMYPRALDYVENAARAGERGERVSTHLGRSTPPTGTDWHASQQSSSAPEQRRAESAARSRGRFTRNFVVQGTAAEWACCWLAELRRRLRALPPGTPSTGGLAVAGGPQLVAFLHDEVVVHCPVELVEEVSAILHDSSQAATDLLFGPIPLAFPVNVSVVQCYADAK